MEPGQRYEPVSGGLQCLNGDKHVQWDISHGMDTIYVN